MRYLITGGSANGKSTFSEQLALSLPGPRYYIAAMQPYGAEGRERVARHRAMRAGKGFVTIERYTRLSGLLLPIQGGTVLLECLCNLTANEMFDPTRSCDALADAYDDPASAFPPDVDPYAAAAVLDGVAALERQCGSLLVVTNDVGSDGGGYAASTMAYVRTLGYINRRLAARFERVIELVAGIPLAQKGELP